MESRRSWSSILAMILAIGLMAGCSPAPVPQTATFSNAQRIEIPANAGAVTIGPAFPYPSPITVSGMPSSVTNIEVTLYDLSHTLPGDVEVLLVGPSGAHVILLSDAPPAIDNAPPTVNATLTFSAIADTYVTAPIVSGMYLPTMFYPLSITLPAPAPQGPYPDSLDVFDGTDPNGTWNLYVADDFMFDVGDIGNGWALSVTSR